MQYLFTYNIFELISFLKTFPSNDIISNVLLQWLYLRPTKSTFIYIFEKKNIWKMFKDNGIYNLLFEQITGFFKNRINSLSF